VCQTVIINMLTGDVAWKGEVTGTRSLELGDRQVLVASMLGLFYWREQLLQINNCITALREELLWQVNSISLTFKSQIG